MRQEFLSINLKHQVSFNYTYVQIGVGQHTLAGLVSVSDKKKLVYSSGIVYMYI